MPYFVNEKKSGERLGYEIGKRLGYGKSEIGERLGYGVNGYT